jgi:hypothetical protein
MVSLRGQSAGEAEVSEDGGVGEEGHPGDRVPLERQREQSEGARAIAVCASGA